MPSTDPEKRKAYSWRGRAKEKALEAGIDIQIDMILPGEVEDAYGTACHICGDEADMLTHLDIADGHVLSNVRPICRGCLQDI